MYPTENEIITEEKVRNTLLSIKLAPVICLAGPSGNGKSTIISYLLSKESNKLFSKNIGDASQTSLIRTKLYINDSVPMGYVYIKGIRRRYSMDYQFQVLKFLQSKLYKERDELEEFELKEEDLKDIFNPVDKSYHMANYIYEAGIDLSDLIDILNELANSIINITGDVSLIKEAKDMLNKLKASKKTVKLQECFERIVEERFNKEQDFINKIDEWFAKIEVKIESDFHDKWIIKDKYIWFGEEKSNELKKLMNAIYNKNSVFSIVFEELQYVVAPTDDFKRAYINFYKTTFPAKPLRICILDTPGITQTGSTEKIIRDEIENILSLPMDALLFLCASNEHDTVYQYCIEALLSNEKLLSTKPVTVCRTKLDIIIRNKLININREETGSNDLKNEVLDKFLKKAYEQFINEFINEENLRFKENTIGDNKLKTDKAISYVSLAPDVTEKYKIVLPDVFDEKRIFNIILDLSLAIDKKYAINGFVKIGRKNMDKSPIHVTCNSAMVHNLVSNLCAKNQQQNTQYTQYLLKKDGTEYYFATRSINTFSRKHRSGNGHDTHAEVYDNFKLYVVQMVQRWINEYFYNTNVSNISNLYNIDFDNMVCKDDQDEQVAKNNMIKSGNITFTNDLTEVVHSVATAICYNAMADEFNACYALNTAQCGFKRMLKLFSAKFSDQSYLYQAIEHCMSAEIENRALRTCIVE